MVIINQDYRKNPGISLCIFFKLKGVKNGLVVCFSCLAAGTLGLLQTPPNRLTGVRLAYQPTVCGHGRH